MWGRGRRQRKVCILAAGRDTAAKRDGCDDRHGREVKKNKVMFGDVRSSAMLCACLLLASSLPLPPCSLLCGDSKNGKDFISRRIGPSNQISIRLLEKDNMFELFDCC